VSSAGNSDGGHTKQKCCDNDSSANLLEKHGAEVYQLEASIPVWTKLNLENLSEVLSAAGTGVSLGFSTGLSRYSFHYIQLKQHSAVFGMPAMR
jgi:hypothetical protein